MALFDEARVAFPAAALERSDWQPYEADATLDRGLRGNPDAVLLPRSADEVAALLGWCYERDLPIVPRGGGTGFSGGATPLGGGIVIGVERLRTVGEIDPASWTLRVGAGLTTWDVQRLARESGLWYPVDPGAGEASCIGGNVATNAGGPHAFKYGVTGHRVLALEAALAPGELVALGAGTSKDVAGYDIAHLMVGSEGTLGIVTEVTLGVLPAREAALPLVAVYADLGGGCEALEAARACGAVPAVLEFVDGATLALTGLPSGLAARAEDAALLLIAEADGPKAAALEDRELLHEALADGALAVHVPADNQETAALWRWRDGIAHGVNSLCGGKLSEDIAVPPNRLAEGIEQTLAIGARQGLPACSWGHAGDGNLHSTFLISPADQAAMERAERAAEELFEFAVAVGGTPSGEHGIGLVKHAAVERHLPRRLLDLQREIKASLDPKGLLNPGKKVS